MSLAILYHIAVIALCVAAPTIAVSFVPEGYEDENGFHYGRRP